MPDLRCLVPAGRTVRRLAALVLGLLIAVPATAQDAGVITGTVVDARTQEPLSDINVVVVGTLLGATTGPDGTFRIEDVPPDTYTVQVSALGYRTARWSVEVAPGETADVTFRLTPEAAGAQADGEAVEAEAFVPRAELLGRQLRELNAPDPGYALRPMAGAGAGRRGALGFEPYVRGLTGARLGVLIDGVRLRVGDPLRAVPPLSYLDPGAVERLEVVEGPYALTEGAGLLSAVRVDLPGFEEEPPTGGWLQGGFRGNGQAAETAGALGGGLFGIPFRVVAAYRTGQAYETGAGQTVPAHYESGGVHGRVEVPLTAASRLAVWGFLQDQRDVRYPGLTLDLERATTGYGAVRYRLAPSTGPVRRFEAQAFAGQALREMTNAQKPPVEDVLDERLFDIALDAETQHFGGRAIAEFAPLRGILLSVGGDVDHVSLDATRALRLRETGAVPPFFTTGAVWPDVAMTDVGFFVNGARALGPVGASGTLRLDLVRADADRVGSGFLENAGGLAEDDLEASEANWSGSLVLSTPLTPAWTLSLGVGSAARPADALERYSDRFAVRGPLARIEGQGDPTLAPERSTQGDLWLRGTFERGEVQVGGFARRVSDYITLAPTDVEPLLPFDAETVYRYVNGTATFYGVDATGRFAVNPLLTLFGRASYLWGHDETLDEPAPGVLPLSADLGLRVEAPFNEELFFEGVARLSAARDRVATTWGETDTDGYATLDLRLGFAPASRASLILTVANVTDADYVYPLNARNPFTGAYVPEPGRSFGINLRVGF